MVVPEGFVLPPWQLLVPLVVVLLGVAVTLWVLGPPVTDRTVLAFVPWIMLGSTLHVLHRIEAYPAAIEGLFATPGVYLTTAFVGGVTWLVGLFLTDAGLYRSSERFLGTVGTGLFVAFTVFTLYTSWEFGSFSPFWPVIAVVVAGILTALAWIALSLWFTEVAAVTAATGALVVFGHALDGVSTAIGYDVLGATEEVPLSLLILEAGESLPTYEYLGAGWLFVVVKMALALGIVGLFKEFVRESPRQARLVLVFVAAVGLGPGVHNILLFTIT